MRKAHCSRIWSRGALFIALMLLGGARASAQMQAGAGASAQTPGAGRGAVIESANGPNAASQRAKPYVVLVSLDGFRHDYVKKYSAPNIAAMAARGASAPDGMIPAYPSVTFPNHLTLITGLYPEHHGIVANIFYDPARQQRYAYSDSGRRSGWKLVQRRAALVAGRAEWDALSLLFLARVGSGNRGKAPELLLEV
jgi:hypothetical protein